MEPQQEAFLKRKIRKYQRQGYAWFIAWAKATEQGINRFIIWPIISKMKIYFIKELANQLKTIQVDRERHQG